MIFYHGTNQLIITIDFSKSRSRTDFGRGFYLSDKLGNARDWAVDKTGTSGVPTVMRYEVDNLIFHDSQLNFLRFENPTIEWLNFVRDNRRKNTSEIDTPNPRHSYDVVTGPIADDKVAIAVDKYCKEKLTAEETLNEVRTIPNIFQLSMHTPLATTYILSASYSQLISKRWNNWQSVNKEIELPTK